MPVKQYINTKAYNTAKKIGRGLVLPFVLLAILTLLLGLQGKAAEQSITHEQGNSVVVYSAADSSITITEGKITATAGQSIRLLPGTHVKATSDESLAINIADKQQQEALAREEARRREERMLAEVKQKQENKLIPKINTGINSWCTKGVPPVQGSTISRQNIVLVALSTTSTVSAKAPVSTIQNKTNIQNIHTQRVSTVETFMPSRSWGNAAETIKVLRC